MGNLSSGDDLESLDSDLESTHSDAMLEKSHSDPDLQELLPDIDSAHVNAAKTTRGSDADFEELEETIRNTWSAWVEDYRSDTEDDDFEEDTPHPPL